MRESPRRARHELRTNMFFIAFDDEKSANAYAEGKPGLLI
jgi:hypothetical protein